MSDKDGRFFSLAVPHAEPIGDAPRSAAAIEIDLVVPHFVTLLEQGLYYDHHAQALCDALYRSLPGALWDRLLAKMLATTASYFVRSYEEASHGKE